VRSDETLLLNPAQAGVIATPEWCDVKSLK